MLWRSSEPAFEAARAASQEGEKILSSQTLPCHGRGSVLVFASEAEQFSSATLKDVALPWVASLRSR
jgi:hypothetical protein